MQCAMFCTNHHWCDLVVLTKFLHIERIFADPEFKLKTLPKPRYFYFTAILPELGWPQAVIQEPSEWMCDEWETGLITS